VSWAVGGDYVGWCPLGRRDQPVTLGRAVPRGSLAASAGSSPWVYTRRADLGARETARRRVDLKPEQARALRVSDTPHARPTRDARAIEVRTGVQREAGVPRNTRLRPSPGDTVPEVAHDNRTTIPAPVTRRPRPREDASAERRETPRETQGTAARREAPDDRSESPEVSAPTRSWSRREETSTTRPSWSRERERSASPRARDSEPRDDGQRNAAPRSRDTDSDRDVLRRMFRPLSERPEPEKSAAPPSERRSEPRAEPRSTPRREPSPSTRQATPRPPKDKDKR
jgi:hypothetical protein